MNPDDLVFVLRAACGRWVVRGAPDRCLSEYQADAVLAHIEPLLDLARVVQSMVEDGHPTSSDWFEVITRHMEPVRALLDAEATT